MISTYVFCQGTECDIRTLKQGVKGAGVLPGGAGLSSGQNINYTPEITKV